MNRRLLHEALSAVNIKILAVAFRSITEPTDSVALFMFLTRTEIPKLTLSFLKSSQCVLCLRSTSHTPSLSPQTLLNLEMAGNPVPPSRDLHGGTAEIRPLPPERRLGWCDSGNEVEKCKGTPGEEGRPDPEVSLLAGATGAKYKLMSPAKLPITRVPCLTIPQGFSPSALLESHVLTNMKVRYFSNFSLFVPLVNRFFCFSFPCFESRLVLACKMKSLFLLTLTCFYF